MDIRKLFGDNVRHYRKALGLTQEAVAEIMGVDRAYISLIERGAQNVTLLSIWEIGQALQVHPSALLSETEHSDAAP